LRSFSFSTSRTYDLCDWNPEIIEDFIDLSQGGREVDREYGFRVREELRFELA